MPYIKETDQSSSLENADIYRMFDSMRYVNGAFARFLGGVKGWEYEQRYKLWKPQAREAIQYSSTLMLKYQLTEAQLLHRGITFSGLDPSAAVLARAIWGPGSVTPRVYTQKMRNAWCGLDLPYEFDTFLPQPYEAVFVGGFQHARILPTANILLTTLREMDLVQDFVAKRMQR
jgi:hypothetical protein